MLQPTGLELCWHIQCPMDRNIQSPMQLACWQKAKQNYCQLEKEALSCIFGVKWFYQYISGHKFQLWTDHKPMLALINEQQSTLQQASACIKYWSLHFSSFDYSLKFWDTKSHADTDALSRLLLPTASECLFHNQSLPCWWNTLRVLH